MYSMATHHPHKQKQTHSLCVSTLVPILSPRPSPHCKLSEMRLRYQGCLKPPASLC